MRLIDQKSACLSLMAPGQDDDLLTLQYLL